MGKIKVKFCLTHWTDSPQSRDEFQIVDIEVPFDTANKSPRITAVGIENDMRDKESASYPGQFIMDQVVPVLTREDTNNLVGRLLTQIDATFTDLEQRKAQKDIIRQIVWDFQNTKMREAGSDIGDRIPSILPSGHILK